MGRPSLVLGASEEVGCGTCDGTLTIDGRFMPHVRRFPLSGSAQATAIPHADGSWCAQAGGLLLSRWFVQIRTGAVLARDSSLVNRDRCSKQGSPFNDVVKIKRRLLHVDLHNVRVDPQSEIRRRVPKEPLDDGRRLARPGEVRRERVAKPVKANRPQTQLEQFVR